MSKRLALGKAIKAIRTAKQIPGGKLASDCLMSHAHLSNIEADRRDPTPEALALIAQHLGVHLDAISVDLDGDRAVKAAARNVRNLNRSAAA